MTASSGTSPRRKRAIVLGFAGRPHVVEEARRLRPTIEKQVDVVVEDFASAVDLSQVEADVAIVFGGDGSILRAAHQMGYHQLPVLAVNLGRLGYLADLTPNELPEALKDFCAGKLEIVEHLMFECRVLRGGDVRVQALGLNETAIHCGPPYALIEVDLYVDSELATTYSGDGLIVSTPVGSTAHSLSAGGPILRKNMQAFVFAPLSPHTLTNRSVVDTADHVYELAVRRPNPATAVIVDGHVLCTLESEDRVRIERAAPRFLLVNAPGHSYYRTLREKLGWGGQLTK